MKPSEKKAPTSRSKRKKRRAPARPRVKAETPPVETPAANGDAKPDETVAAGTDPQAASAQDGSTEADAQQAAQPPADGGPTEPEQSDAPAPPTDPEPEASSAVSGTVMLGTVQCRAETVPLAAVLGALGSSELDRINAIEGHDSVAAEQKLMLATDGRATPAIFEDRGQEADPAILHGFEAIAAAKASGRESILVILVPQGEVDAVQPHIVKMVQGRQKHSESEDDLILHVHAHYRDG